MLPARPRGTTHISPSIAFWMRPGTLPDIVARYRVANSSLEGSPTRVGFTPRAPAVFTILLAVVDDFITSVALCHGATALPEFHLDSARTTPPFSASWCVIWFPAALWAYVPRYFREMIVSLGIMSWLCITIRAKLTSGCPLIATPLARIDHSCFGLGSLCHSPSATTPRCLISRR